MKRILSGIMAIFICASMCSTAFAIEINYLPDVRREMSEVDFWTEDNEVLMTFYEVEKQNRETVSKKETCMYDLKNQPEIVNTVSLNEALITSTKADINYYLGWVYLGESEKLATEADFESIVANTQNPESNEKSAVKYGVVTKRTNLHTFPSHIAVLDDPGDPECNYQYLESVRVNEPVVITSVSNDGKFYLAKNNCCSGWIPAEDIAICKDKEEWLSAWDIAAEKSLVVYGDRVYTEMSVSGKETSEVLLTMGTVLELAEVENLSVLIDNRSCYQNYVVYMPVRNNDGSYSKKLTLIPENEKVNIGYLPMTKSNIVSVAFEALGNTYGWGNWLNSDDCSGYVRNIYKCFGLVLARNTTWQSAMPMAKIDMQYMCREERMNILEKMPVGSVLFFNGHEMLYLGSENGNHYVVSAVGSIMNPYDSSVRQRIRSTVVNSLETRRANGNTWLDELTVALLPYWLDGNENLPSYEWYHNGVAFCLKNKLMQLDNNKLFNLYNGVTRGELYNILWTADGDCEAENNAQGNADMSEVLTREAVASELYAYAKSEGLDVDGNSEMMDYKDVSEISEDAVAAMEFVVKNGIMNGKTKQTINPKDKVSRAELAVIIERFWGIINK